MRWKRNIKSAGRRVWCRYYIEFWTTEGYAVGFLIGEALVAVRRILGGDTGSE